MISAETEVNEIKKNSLRAWRLIFLVKSSGQTPIKKYVFVEPL